MFIEADKAILTQASLWLSDKPFQPGDYIATVAMHVNTKEVPAWTLQSVWSSDAPDTGPYAADRPDLSHAIGPWQHYLLTQSYDFAPDENGQVAKAVNPYIEGVIHPIATSCRNCHVRAGWPGGMGLGQTSYQTAECHQLLSYLEPDSLCFKGVALTDFAWIVPDRAQ